MSLIIPTHGRPQLLARAVESGKLAGRDVELVVVDDASTDSTAEVCRALKGIKYVRLEHNLGVAGARNAGLLASSAEYIAFLDDDDLRLASSIDLQLAALARQPEAGFVCGSMLLADQEGRLTGERSAPNHLGGDIFWELMEMAFPVMPISVLFRKECFFRVGLFRNRLAGIDDWDIFVRIAELYPVVVMGEAVGIYRQPTPSSGQGSSRLARHLTRAIRHQQELLRLPRAMSASAERRKQARKAAINRVANTLFRNAAEGLPTGSYGFACANILSALRLDPLYAARPGVYKKLFKRALAP
ncbi:MAG TPA: glycosyltransferase family 2 protein [Pyrinomonadaceae bacterium]